MLNNHKKSTRFEIYCKGVRIDYFSSTKPITKEQAQKLYCWQKGVAKNSIIAVPAKNN